MGFWGDLWDGIKNTASNVWSGVKNVASTVYNTVRKPIDWISSGLNVASKIPVLGSIVAPVRGVVDTAKSVLDQGKAIGDVVKQVGLREGGVVKPAKKYYQAME